MPKVRYLYNSRSTKLWAEEWAIKTIQVSNSESMKTSPSPELLRVTNEAVAIE